MRTNPYASGPLPPKKPGGGIGFGTVIVVLLLVFAVGGMVALTLIPASYRDDAAEPLPPVWAQQSAAGDAPNTLVVPTTLGDRRVISDFADVRKLEQKISRVMTFVPGIDDVISASYGAPSNNSSLDSQRLVSFSAGQLRPALRGTALAQDPFDRLPEHANINVVGIAGVAPGSFEGQAQCGKANIDGYITIACSWADRYTVGLVIFFGSTLEEASVELITVRGQVERRG